MAETDIRLETLEDEVKVLKGEVKRTLVDLRALLMREDSPLGEGALARRMAMQNPGPGQSPGPGNEAPGPAAVPPLGREAAAPGPGALPGPAPQQAASQATPGAGPGPPPAAPFPHGFAPSGAPPADNSVAAAQLERTQAEQERHMAEHDRKMADFENEDEPALPPGRSRLSSRVDPKGSLKRNSRLVREAGGAEVPGENKSDSRGKSERVTSIYDEYRELLEETRPTHTQTQTIEDEPVGPPLDVNLMANLVYWACLAKQRVGEAQLKDILQLYIQSGHSRPELQDLLSHICKMVDVESAVIEENGSDWVDLLFHLHGILTGGFPVMKIPYVRLPAQEEA